MRNDLLQRAVHLDGSEEPSIVIRLLDDDGEVVDLSSGYASFQGKVARRSAPGTAVESLTVTGSAGGFVCDPTGLNTLTPGRTYVLTASAIDQSTSNIRQAQCEVFVQPAPDRT